MPSTSVIASMARSTYNDREFSQSGRHEHHNRGNNYPRVCSHVLPIRISYEQIKRTLFHGSITR